MKFSKMQKLCFLCPLLLFLSLSTDVFCDDDLGEVCYPNLGCFTVRDCPVSGRWVNSLPDKPENINTTFTLYTPDTNETQFLSYDDPLSLEAIQPEHKLAILVHGFGNIGEHLPALGMAMKTVTPQVVIVDWQRGSRLPYFNYAVVNTQLIGHQIAYLLFQLNKHRGVEYKRVHLIGFSLGAHVSAFASRYLKKTYGGKIGRISALDAASPYFEGTCFHLNSSDADFVDAIHTNADDRLPKIISRVGSRAPFAHIDFYPNGGRKQPHCSGRWWDLICNHYAAIDLYKSSIKSKHFCSFNALKCPDLESVDKDGSCTEGPNAAMGYFSDRYLGRGIYYLKTMDKSPFCLS